MATTNFDSIAVPADAFLAGGVKVPDHLLLAVPIDATFLGAARSVWIADRAYTIVTIKESHSVVGGSGALVRPRKVTGTTAPGAAAGATVKELTAADISLTSTINTVVTPALSATAGDLVFAVGDRLCLNPGGTVTAVIGSLTFVLQAT